MKLLLIFLSFSLLPLLQGQTDSDLVVVKFTWSKYRQNSDLIHSVADPGPAMNEPVRVNPQPKSNEPQEVKNRRDMQERRADMMAAENNAKVPSGRNQDHYLLHLEVKNVGTNTIKNVVWEYQPTAQSSGQELRQYVCTMKAKPNDKKTFELITPFSPVKVVNADAEAGPNKDGRVVINRLEYADGTVWKREGWSVLIPNEVTAKIENGKCIGF